MKARLGFGCNRVMVNYANLAPETTPYMTKLHAVQNFVTWKHGRQTLPTIPELFQINYIDTASTLCLTLD